jgi:hypothetical protein
MYAAHRTRGLSARAAAGPRIAPSVRAPSPIPGAPAFDGVAFASAAAGASRTGPSRGRARSPAGPTLGARRQQPACTRRTRRTGWVGADGCVQDIGADGAFSVIGRAPGGVGSGAGLHGWVRRGGGRNNGGVQGAVGCRWPSHRVQGRQKHGGHPRGARRRVGSGGGVGWWGCGRRRCAQGAACNGGHAVGPRGRRQAPKSPRLGARGGAGGRARAGAQKRGSRGSRGGQPAGVGGQRRGCKGTNRCGGRGRGGGLESGTN